MDQGLKCFKGSGGSRFQMGKVFNWLKGLKGFNGLINQMVQGSRVLKGSNYRRGQMVLALKWFEGSYDPIVQLVHGLNGSTV